jgi:uncharacterized protein (TIGR02147 family)
MEIKALLIREYQRRRENNHRYSQRAFAKDLGLSKSYLNELLNTNKQASSKMIERIASRLKLTYQEINQMIDAQLQGLVLTEESDYADMYHWYHFAVLNLIETKDSSAEVSFFVNRLGLDEKKIEETLQLLLNLNLIRLDGNQFIRVHDQINTQMDIPSHAIKCLHSENLHRAEKALFELDVDLRECTSVTFAGNYTDYKKIKQETKRFRQKISKIAKESKSLEQVFTVAVQVFPQTKVENIIINKEKK